MSYTLYLKATAHRASHSFYRLNVSPFLEEFYVFFKYCLVCAVKCSRDVSKI